MANFMQPEENRKSKIPGELPILPLRNTLAYPSMVLPLAVGIPRSIKLIEDALQGDRLLGLVGMEDGSIEEPTSEQVYQVGTVARIHRVVRSQDETMQVIVQGIERFEVDEWLEPTPYLRARIRLKPDVGESDLEMDALQRSLKELSREVVALSPHLPDEVNKFLGQVEDPKHLIYLVTANARIQKEEGQAILETDELKEKFRILIKHLSREKDILTLEQKIQTEAHEEMDKAQREYFLRQQLKAIRKELGDEEETSAVIDEYREKLESTGMPAEARKETLRELKRLDGMPPQAAEYSLIKTYIDWMVELPWQKRSEDQLDIDRARRVLDEDHYDLKEVKDRILEYLAVRKLIGEREAEKDAAGETVADAAKPATADPTDAATTGNGRRGGRRARKRSGPAASGPDADADGAAATARRPDSTGDKPHATGGESDRTGDEPDATRGGSDRIGDEPDATRRESEPTGGRVERRGTPNARTQRRDGGNGGLTPGSRSSRSPRPILPLEDVIGIFSVVPDEDITDLELSRQIDEYTEDFVAELEEASEKAKEEEGEASRGDEAGPEPPGEADPEPRSEDDSERKPRPDPDPAPESDEGADEKPDARAGTILCFVGPPGVGKTSLGKSIARALGRKFTRMSLGGMRDEAEIRGHRRTYIGALPGRIIQGIKRAGTRNPVFMLDEVDKIGADWRGDPASALLEVLDPAQNHAYRDHYLDVDFDLSDVIFIATANNLETIPQALRDRMEILQLEGYTDHDKLRIAEQYLVPRQRRSNGLREDEVRFTEEAIRKIIHDYTREAGVRELERQIGTVCRKAAVGIAEGSISELAVTPEIVRAHLKAERYHSESSEEFRIPGVATGLAVTAGGGDILYIEATRMKGKGGLTLTGHLGDVMKESAQIASSYVRSKAAQYGIDPEIFEKTDVHVHVPAGAIPKDGPSAGVAMVAATVSLLTGRKVRHDVGMTGEVTLRGRVLPVGGVKMKVLAAHRAGLTTVVLPKKNEPDLEELPEVVRREMTFVPVEVIDEGLKTILEPEIEESSGRPPGDPTERRAIAEAQRT